MPDDPESELIDPCPVFKDCRSAELLGRALVINASLGQPSVQSAGSSCLAENASVSPRQPPYVGSGSTEPFGLVGAESALVSGERQRPAQADHHHAATGTHV